MSTCMGSDDLRKRREKAMNPYCDEKSHSELIAEIRERQDLRGGDLVDNFHIEDGEYGEWSGLELLKAYAECLDKAHKREIEEIGAGNVAKLRETLHDIGNACAWIADNNATDPTGQTQRYLRDIVVKVKEALDSPQRNCDKYPPLREAMIAFAKEKKDLPYPTPDFTFSAWLLEIAKDEKGKDKK